MKFSLLPLFACAAMAAKVLVADGVMEDIAFSNPRGLEPRQMPECCQNGGIPPCMCPRNCVSGCACC
ncbi:hypothetical protein MCOR27_005374 [Pyricularia oryzae]|nr:hypothetical protein MCOR27_005374 [Pyricularia oryzae]KAI6286103.1 hypothetical protein MCOR26_001182 [Pyricularia oryzae]KAI6336755.1 hypothetical protein MCOR29_000133 [Pyricularia oryzae]KAI6434152.1 hypothetical protein MCOR24_000956 [Pyricularia oryzae]KAI6437939.1 hypothetical protein MCOR21_000169 [Pyricularia oryzae]